MSEITQLLEKCQSGEPGAKDRLYTLLYADLKRLARTQLAKSGPITLDPSAMVHDLWLRCVGTPSAHNRQQFFSYASAVMRSVVVDHVRAHAAQKRDRGIEVTLSTACFDDLPAQPDLLGIDDALTALKDIDTRCHSVVEMRYFCGMTLEEIADALQMSVPTIKRDWQRARAFLFDFLKT
jgi:RNA polymerase sigma factor (TIGR02999 family)